MLFCTLVVQISLPSTSQGCSPGLRSGFCGSCCSAVFLIFYHQVTVYKPKVLFGFVLYLQKKNTKSNSSADAKMSKSVYILKNLNLSVNSMLRIHFSHIHTLCTHISKLNSIIDASHKLFYLYWL